MCEAELDTLQSEYVEPSVRLRTESLGPVKGSREDHVEIELHGQTCVAASHGQHEFSGCSFASWPVTAFALVTSGHRRCCASCTPSLRSPAIPDPTNLLRRAAQGFPFGLLPLVLPRAAESSRSCSSDPGRRTKQQRPAGKTNWLPRLLLQAGEESVPHSSSENTRG